MYTTDPARLVPPGSVPALHHTRLGRRRLRVPAHHHASVQLCRPRGGCVQLHLERLPVDRRALVHRTMDAV